MLLRCLCAESAVPAVLLTVRLLSVLAQHPALVARLCSHSGERLHEAENWYQLNVSKHGSKKCKQASCKDLNHQKAKSLLCYLKTCFLVQFQSFSYCSRSAFCLVVLSTYSAFDADF